tara:strand:- start:1139 stop:2893 length:1755 start_codon:yes stop_codon:yes gene_type:complete
VGNIKILPENIANQIAAGEVIQRPSSALKETLENSIDSGAKNISVYIKKAGKTYLQISDDGCGMSKDDVKKCFKRHATSKINKINDLFKIKTMGFRGEALASIASIAQVEITTKRKIDILGVKILIENGKIKEINDCTSTNGTSIKIKNLFYNVPARRNFLKSDQIEFRHISKEFVIFSLANPEICVKLYHNNSEIYYLEKSNLRQRIVNILGRNKNEMLVPIKEKTSLVELNGFIGKPETAKKTRGEQYIFVNKRYIRHRNINKIIQQSYEELIAKNYIPSYFINLEIPTNLIDINIHPTKTEIKFENENAVIAIIGSTIKHALGKYNIAPSIDFSQEISFNLPYKKEKEKILKEPKIKIDKNYNPFENQDEKIPKQKIIYESSELDNKDLIKSFASPIIIKKKFIVFQSTDEELLIIHKKRAHKRILFEYFQKNIENKTATTQKLLFEKKIILNKEDIKLILELEKDLNLIGFSLKKIEENCISINSVPAECNDENVQETIENILEQFKNEKKITTNRNKKIAISLADSMSISNSKNMTKEEMIKLKTSLMNCNFPSVCPRGKKAVFKLSYNDLEKYFNVSK